MTPTRASDDRRRSPKLGDLREAGTWTRRQALKNDLIYALVRCSLAIFVPLPPRLLRAIGRALGILAFALLPRTRRTARETIARALPELPASRRTALLWRSYVRLGAHLGDAIGSLDAHRPLRPLSIDASALALLTRPRTDSKGEPRGVLFASAHLGPWERVASTLVARGAPMTVVARETYDPRLRIVYDRLREARGLKAIYRGQPGASVRIVRVLRQGGVLGIPMDLRSRVPSVETRFLGQEVDVPVGPARIALRTGAAVVVGTVAPDPAAPSGLSVTCTEIPTDDLASGPAGERELTRRLAAELTRRIQTLPEEWIWMHDRFAR